MGPLEQIINSLEHEPNEWVQTDYTLDNKNGVSLWTANIPFLNTRIYNPARKLGFIGKIRLQLAINKWHKKPLILDT